MINRTISNDLSPSFRHTDFGYFAGGGVERAPGTGALVAETRGTFDNPRVRLMAVEAKPFNSRSHDRPASIQFKGRGGARW